MHKFIIQTIVSIIPLFLGLSLASAQNLKINKIDNKYGFVDENGNQVVPCQYDWVDELSYNGYYLVYKGAVEPEFKHIPPNGGFGFINNTGHEIIPLKYKNAKFVFGYPEVLFAVKKNGLWGVIDTSFNEIIPFRYNWINSEFINGQIKVFKGSIVKRYSNNEKPSLGSFGFINFKGTEVIPCKLNYDYVWDFSKGFAIITKDSQYSFINKKGELRMPLIFEYMSDFDVRFGISIIKYNNKWGCIDTLGNYIFPNKFTSKDSLKKHITKTYKDFDYIRVSKHIFRRKHKIVANKNSQPENTNFYDFIGYYSEEIAIVRKENNWGAIDINGNELFPCNLKCDEIEPFRKSFAKVKKGNMYSLIDTLGQVIIPFMYDEIGSFSYGFAKVKRESKYGFIDKNGNEVIECKYDIATPFINGWTKVKQNNKWEALVITDYSIKSYSYDKLPNKIKKIFMNTNHSNHEYIDLLYEIKKVQTP